MNKGAIPIPYVVAIIFAVAIIAIIGYWFFTSSNSGVAGAATAQCLAAKTNFCQDWYRAGASASAPTGNTHTILLSACGVTATPADVSNFAKCKTFIGLP